MIYEKNIHKAIILHLNRIPVTKAWKRRAGPFEKGRADITGSCFGIRIEIEVKRPGGRIAPKQQDWINKADSLMCITGFAESVEDAMKILHRYFTNWSKKTGADVVKKYLEEHYG